MELPFDVNAVAGSLLRDLAAIQTSRQKAFAYKRAAAFVLALERPLTALRQRDGTLPKMPGIGPSSSRVIQEVLQSGASATVERLVEASGQAADIRARRGRRQTHLSRAAALAVLDNPALEGVRPDDYRGDLQMHSEWSDGVPTLAEIVEGGRARGYRYCAVTDHSHGLPIAGGMSMEAAGRQHRAIDELNRAQGKRFRLIKGIEANIAADGSLDLSDEEAAAFELVLAAPHSKLRLKDDQTARLVAAVRHPRVRILAHPRGRVSGTRDGIVAAWPAVFAAAARAGVAVELDGDPARQDLDYVLAAQALEAGCLFAVDSDAHTIDQLRYSDIGLAHARLAGIPADRIINCWTLERLMTWLAVSGR